jgi:hypothetical protein
MNRKDQCCGNCNAFLVDEGRKPNSPPGNPLQGFCRAYPATPVQTMVQVGSLIEAQRRMAAAIQGILVPVTATAWCRCWEPEDSNHWTERP